MALPTGVVSFLFTDLVGSSERWDRARDEMSVAVRRHDELIAGAVRDASGDVVKSMGDGIMAAFADPADAITAALAAQAAIRAERWDPVLEGISVRMGVHTGPVEMHGDDDYLGPTVNRAARIEAAGHGGQLLVSAAARALASDRLADVTFRDLGEHHLRGLTAPERVYQAFPDGLSEDFPPLKTESTPTNLPFATHEIIGRDSELDAIVDELASARAVTIVGAGGAGKTTLALEAARRVSGHFPAGVWLVELAGLNDGLRVATEILGAVRRPATAGRDHVDVLIEQLAGQRALVVLDNCEHLLGDVADVVSRIVRSTDSVTVLATSREPLAVNGETIWRIPVLSLPAGDSVDDVMASGAGALFSERARAADNSFRLSDANADVVARVCRRVDGLPLAVELACARLRSMSLADLDRRLDDRFRVLKGGTTELPHHRTLRDTVAWSYDLLSDAEQRLYRRLSVFAGGFDLDAAESIAADTPDEDDVLDHLDHLVAQSLIQHHDGRYRMLETIRQFGSELLHEHSETEAASSAHLAWLLDLAKTGARHLEGKDQPVWMERFNAEIDNIRAGLSWARRDDAVTGALIAASLTRFFWMNAMEADTRQLTDSRSFLDEGYDWATTLLDAAGDDLPPKIRGRLQSGIGGLLCVRSGRSEEAVDRLADAQALLGGVGDDRLLGWAIFYDGIAGWGLRPLDETVEKFIAALALHKASKDMGGQLFSMALAGLALARDGRHDESREYADPFVDMALQTNVPTLVAHALDTSAFLDGVRDEVDAASCRRAVDALDKFRANHNYACVNHALAAASSVFVRLGDDEAAGIAMGVAEAIRDRLNMVVAPHENRTAEVIAILTEERGVDGWDEARSKGRTMEPDEGIDWTIDRLELAGRSSSQQST